MRAACTSEAKKRQKLGRTSQRSFINPVCHNSAFIPWHVTIPVTRYFESLSQSIQINKKGRDFAIRYFVTCRSKETKRKMFIVHPSTLALVQRTGKLFHNKSNLRPLTEPCCIKNRWWRFPIDSLYNVRSPSRFTASEVLRQIVFPIHANLGT